MTTFIMKFKTSLLETFYLCHHIGTDSFGNKYYEQTIKNKPSKRWVLYNGLDEPSKIPPLWYGWLHHSSKSPPQKIIKVPYQKIHLPNLSGTQYAYKPSSISQVYKKYEAWTPERNEV
jgi:NADH:ubiquinone oxidoreductase subunit